MKTLSLALASGVLSLGVFATSAQAQQLPVVGGLTSVKLTAAPVIVGAGLTVGGVGSAFIAPGSDTIPIAYFPVTGGSIDTGTFAGTILHDGSGLSLSGNGSTVSLTDFVIDTVGGQLSGLVTANGASLGSVSLFTIGLSGTPAWPFSLTLTPTAGAALAQVFGIPNLGGAQLGIANTIPIAVPEPATVASMLAGLAMLGLVLARRRGLGRSD